MSDASNDPGRVISLQVLRAHGERPEPRPAVRLLVGRGVEDDLHGKGRAAGSDRQVLLVDRQTLQTFGLNPGDLREQITVEFADLERLPAGAHLRIGSAALEVTGPCDPCTHIGKLNGRADVEAFRRSLQGRRGRLARVIAVDGDGMVRVGDPVRRE